MIPRLLNMPEGLGENRKEEFLHIAPFVRLLAETLDREQIQWAVLRNAEGLPNFTRYDIDLLTLPRHLNAFLQVVERCAAKTGWLITGRIKKHRYTCLMLVKQTKQGVFYLPLDLFAALEFRGVNYLNAEEILHKRIRTTGGVWTLPSGTAATIMLLKEWLQHGHLKERKQEGIQSVLMRDPQSFIDTLKSAVGSRWMERIRKSEWTLSPTDRRALRRAARGRSPLWVMGWLRSAWANVAHLFRPSLGMVVCLAGADGSGKTTLAQGLAEKTLKKPFKGCRYIHGNIGVLPRFRDIRKALGIGRTSDQPVAESEHLQGMMEPVPAWKSVLLASYYAVDFFLARLLIRRWRGQWLLTVMDRSFYDYYYQLGHRNCPRWILNGLSLLAPKPDLLLCVEGDAEAIHARKPELTVEEIQIEQNILRDLSARLPFAGMLNGCGGVDMMVKAGAKEIFQTLEERSVPSRGRFQALEIGGKPLAAVPSGSEFWKLFPATSPKRRLIRDVMRALSAIGVDRLVCSGRELHGELISIEEIEELLSRLTEQCGGERPDYLLSWPAQIERQRIYLVFRAPSGKTAGVIKIGTGEFNRRQLSNEADVLQRLAGKDLSFSVPSFLFSSELDENRMALALGNFPCQSRRVRAPDAVEFGRQVIEELAGFSHGDLGAANMLRFDRGRLFVLDWENASEQAPRLTDPVGLWLSSRQKEILQSPKKIRPALRQAFDNVAENELSAALCFLSAHDNLAAGKLLEAWTDRAKQEK